MSIIALLQETITESQSFGVRLTWDPSGLECWSQPVFQSLLILLKFRYDVAPQPLLISADLENPAGCRQGDTLRLHKFKMGQCGCSLSSLNLRVTLLLPLLHQVPRHWLWKLGHIPCTALWGMAKTHVCSRLGREIKACQEKPGHCGGVGTGRDGMNKRRVQTKSGLLRLSTINHQLQSGWSFLINMQGTTVGRRRKKIKRWAIKFTKVSTPTTNCPHAIQKSARLFLLSPSSHLSPNVMSALIPESCWCFKLLTSQRRFFSVLVVIYSKIFLCIF